MDEDLLRVVAATGTLCLDVDDPGWDDARGYLFDPDAEALYFPIAKKYLQGDLNQFSVLIWSQPRLVVVGELHRADSEEEGARQLALAEARGMPTEKARYMVLDQRNGRPRKTRHKLLVREVRPADN